MRKIDRQLIPYSTTIDVQITNGSLRTFNFPDNELLRGKTVIGIAVRRQNSSDTAQTESGRTLVDDDALAVCFITLEADSIRVLDSIPAELVAFDPDDRRYTPIELRGFTPTKSTIEFSDTTNISTGESLEITFIYTD